MPNSFLQLATVFEALKRGRRARGDFDATDVQKALGLRSLFLAKRLLVALAADARQFETAEEFIRAAERMMAAPVPEKIEFLFSLHDVDGDGWIRRQDLDLLIHVALVEQALQLPESEVGRMVDAIMRAGDQDHDEKIGIEEFRQMMITHPEIQGRLADYGVSLLMPGKRARKRTLPPGSAWGGWVRSGALLASWLAAYAALNAILFLEAFFRYRAAGATIYIQVARGAGACLNLNAALVVVPMLRHTLTWIRRSVLGRAVPVDDAIDVHSLLGGVVVVLSLVHAGAHFLNVHSGRLTGLVLSNLLRATRTNWTGVALLAIFLVMWLFSRRFVRRSGRFELFYITHLGYLASLPLIFLHGPRFWMWGSAPWAWYFLERLLRAHRRRAPIRLLDAAPLRSGVTRLVFARPPGFDYAPGDYAFFRIPAVARHEWHPFTFSSAPENLYRLTVHVRSAGNWTSKLLYRIKSEIKGGRQPAVYIDGPYGTATRHIFDVPHAVAIAAGIGVTPFASILQSLLLGRSNSQLRKLRFVWLANDQHAFEWFRDLLGSLEKRDHEQLLDMHIYLTSGRSDMAGGILDVAQKVMRAGSQGDVVTGLRTHTSLGTPDFDRLLESFYRDPGLPRPHVFFCGPPALGRIVAKSSRRLQLAFRSERF